MRKIYLLSSLLLLSLLVLGAVVAAPEAALLPWMWNTIDGGGDRMSGGTFVLEGTTGQPDAGVLSGGSYELSGGFWAGACTIPIAALSRSGGDVSFNWNSGTNDIYRTVDDPYFTGLSQTQIGTAEGAPFLYAEPLLGDPSQNSYYSVGKAGGCSTLMGEFDFALTPGS